MSSNSWGNRQSAYRNTLHSACKEIVIAERAHRAILAEALERNTTETGGILLGHFVNDGTWYVVEAIDPGMRGRYSMSEFEYDGDYVTHLLNKTSRLYKYPLTLLGVWHRHPNSMDTFSTTDDNTHRNVIKTVKMAGTPRSGVISGLINFDPAFRMTFYYVDNNVAYYKTPFKVGNEHCDPKILKYATVDELHNQYANYKSACEINPNTSLRNSDQESLRDNLKNKAILVESLMQKSRKYDEHYKYKDFFHSGRHEREVDSQFRRCVFIYTFEENMDPRNYYLNIEKLIKNTFNYKIEKSKQIDATANTFRVRLSLEKSPKIRISLYKSGTSGGPSDGCQINVKEDLPNKSNIELHLCKGNKFSVRINDRERTVLSSN